MHSSIRRSDSTCRTRSPTVSCTTDAEGRLEYFCRHRERNLKEQLTSGRKAPLMSNSIWYPKASVSAFKVACSMFFRLPDLIP